jgi:hypothetical protein
MKKLVFIVLLAFTNVIAQEGIYYSENFEKIIIPQNQQVTNILPQGWQNYNSLKVARFSGTQNQHLIFYNLEPNEIFGVGMPEFPIKDKTVLKFKVAVTNKTQPGKLEIKTFNGSQSTVIASIDFNDISLRDSEFTHGNPTAKFQKEVDLSAYAGQTLRFHFEMTAEKYGVILGLDDIQLVVKSTLSIHDMKKEAVTVYPNPANDYIQISGLSIAKNQLYSLNGNLVQTNNSDKIDISTLSKGVYLLQTTDPEGNHYINKVIKK